MLDRWQIILLCLAFIVVWMLGKKLFRKPDPAKTGKAQGPSDSQVESWFGTAQERAAFADQETTKRRVATWTGLSEQAQLQLADDFMTSTFGAETTESYSREERLRIGRMCVMAGDHTP
jgi:hypothetical protein